MPMLVTMMALAAATMQQNGAGTRAVDDNRAFKHAQTEAGEKYTCKRILKAGTRVNAKKVCHTDAEWAEKERQNAREIDDAMAKSNGECRGC